MPDMPGTFRTRPDSPYPFRLQHPPQTRIRMAKLGSPLSEDNIEPLIEVKPLQTRYMDMLLKLDKIPKLHNILASAFTWLLLAGYVVLPGAFTSVKNSRTLADGAGKAGKVAVKAMQNPPLLAVAASCCITGALGMGYLWWVRQTNYVWLLNRIILPGLLNSAAGLITTLVNIYAARNGFWSVTAIVTAAVTGSFTALMMALFFIYDTWLLTKVKKDHEFGIETHTEERGRSLLQSSDREKL